jgi:DNA-binding NarL/FixJ family response regulator
MKVRVLVADDHSVVRQGLRQVLATTDELSVVGEARDAWEVAERMKQGGVDVLLLDMSMPGPSGVELIQRVKREAPRIPVLVLSMHADAQIAARAIKAGAQGYLTKDSEPDLLLQALRRVASGGNFIDPSIAARLIFSPACGVDGPLHGQLSNREHQVFMALVKGTGLVEIADDLSLSPKTVSTHKFRLMQKLGVDNVSELVRYAVRHGLVE